MKNVICLFGIMFIFCSCNNFQEDKYHYVLNIYKPKYEVGDTYCYRSPISNQSFNLRIDSIKRNYDSQPLSGMFSGYEYYEFLSYYYSRDENFYGRIQIDFMDNIYILVGKQHFSKDINNHYTFYDSIKYFANQYYNIYLMDGIDMDSLTSIFYNLDDGFIGLNCITDTFIICK